MFEGLQAIRKELKEAKLENPDKEEIHDGYQLRFVGKDYAKFITGLPTETVLVPDTEWNNQEQNRNSENIFITGNNLDALKHLLNAYVGRIKMIYIDPPYNTGSDGFEYPDKFEFSSDELKVKLGLSEMEVARIKALQGKSSHSAWLTFILPRLILAKYLLAENGIIFISIDDNEQTNLRALCNDISLFGESNFVGQITVASNPRGRDYGGIARMHDYLLVYKKTSEAEINNIRDEDKKFPFEDNMGGFEIRELRNRNIAFTSENRPNLYYPFYINPNKIIDNEFYEISLEKKENWIELYPKESQGYKTVWRWGKEKSKNNLNINILAKKMKDGGYQIIEKYREKNHMARSIWNTKEVNTDKGTLELKNLMGAKVFPFPKPVDMICDIIEMGSNHDSIVLDFFAGSATTAHAVMALNSKDNGHRKYIMVQLDEPTKEDGEARKAGYRTIDQIARDRIKKAAKQLGDFSGFKHYKLAKINDTKILEKIDEFNPNDKTLICDNMVESFSGKNLNTTLKASGMQTLLTTWLVDDGYALTTSVEEKKFGSYTAYTPKESRRLYLIDTGWNSDATKDLLNKIGKNELIVQSIVVYSHSFDFTSLTELKNNLKSVLSNDIKLIERF